MASAILSSISPVLTPPLDPLTLYRFECALRLSSLEILNACLIPMTIAKLRLIKLVTPDANMRLNGP